MTFITPGIPDRDENEVLRWLLERDAAEQARIDGELDERYKDSPVSTAAAVAYAAERQRLAHHFEVFADAVCAEPRSAVREATPGDSPPAMPGDSTTGPSGVPLPVPPLGPSSPPSSTSEAA